MAFADDAGNEKRGICAEFAPESLEYIQCKLDREFLPKGEILMDNYDSIMDEAKRIIDELRMEIPCTKENPCQEH